MRKIVTLSMETMNTAEELYQTLKFLKKKENIDLNKVNLPPDIELMTLSLEYEEDKNEEEHNFYFLKFFHHPGDM